MIKYDHHARIGVYTAYRTAVSLHQRHNTLTKVIIANYYLALTNMLTNFSSVPVISVHVLSSFILNVNYTIYIRILDIKFTEILSRPNRIIT